MHDPIFQQVLGAEWQRLGPIIRRHYFLRSYSDDYICVSGQMDDIHHSTIAKLLIPFGRLFGAIVPYRGRDIPIDVHYSCRPDNAALYWDRAFKFPRGDFHFRSHMLPFGEAEVVEYVRFGVGLRLAVSAEEGALVFRSKGFIWRLGRWHIPVPIGLLFGKAYIEERPVDEETFSMRLLIEHPLFGLLFRYSGRFTLGERRSSTPVAAD
ncbi:DUF4166 domain-containing protein [Aquipseudomonas campi]